MVNNEVNNEVNADELVRILDMAVLSAFYANAELKPQADLYMARKDQIRALCAGTTTPERLPPYVVTPFYTDRHGVAWRFDQTSDCFISSTGSDKKLYPGNAIEGWILALKGQQEALYAEMDEAEKKIGELGEELTDLMNVQELKDYA